MPSSLRRILASRANGARSQGPSTPQGKQRSSQNAIRHGLLARCIVLDKESRASFEALLTQHLDSLQPADGVEFGMVEEMVASYWRMRRAWAIETRLLEDAANAQGESDPVGSIAAAFTSLAASPALALMHRYETRLHLVYQRSLHNLLLLRTLAVRNEPNPISGQSDPVPLDPADAPTGNPDIAADPGIPLCPHHSDCRDPRRISGGEPRRDDGDRGEHRNCPLVPGDFQPIREDWGLQPVTAGDGGVGAGRPPT